MKTYLNKFFRSCTTKQGALVSYALLLSLLTNCGGSNSGSGKEEGSGKAGTPRQYFVYQDGNKLPYTLLQDKIPVRLTQQPTRKQLRDAPEFTIDSSFNFLGDIVVIDKPAPSDTSDLNKSIRSFAPTVEETSETLKGIIRVNNTNLIVQNRIAAQLKPGTPIEALQPLVESLDCTIEKRPGLTRERVSIRCGSGDLFDIIDLANKLYESGLVEYAHADYIAEIDVRLPYLPGDPLFASQWHLHNTGQNGGNPTADINAPEAWDITRGDPSVVIAIIDDAFDDSHEEFAGKVRYKWDFVDEDNIVYPGNPNVETHGTHVAGVAAAREGNNKGGSGSCPNCNLILLRALSGSVSDHADAFYAAAQNGASIISNSWGYPLPADDVVAAIRDVANNGRGGKGCVVLFAMTNTNVDNCAGSTPDISSLAEVIAVSRSTYMDKSGNGGYGHCMEVLAPTRSGNVGITTTDISGPRGSSNDNYYSSFGGTSSSTPLVAGVVGLILSINPQLTRQEVYDILISTCDKIDPGTAQYNAGGFSKTHGYGRVNAHRAVQRARASII